jgi:DNA end-binding protein Ku
VQSKDVGFRLLDAKTRTPIEYKRWCPVCDAEVPWKDVVKGLEISKGEYYIFTPQELAKLKPGKTDTIEIVEFVDGGSISPVYMKKHYFLAPVQEKEKAYFLFREVLLLTAKVAVGRFVMRDKEHVCAIESFKGGMLLTTMNYADEIRDISELSELRDAPRLKSEEVELAKKLVSLLLQKDFDMSRFHDTFAEEIKKALKTKEKTEVVVVEKPGKEKDLMSALRESLKK